MDEGGRVKMSGEVVMGKGREDENEWKCIRWDRRENMEREKQRM